ncbi:hypothetical protein QM012_007136 [Aureobasidium pullulans]|uniref:Pentatricopeptide repeat domain-containing protein n=1 Tax=Aureobasidium pullulans TaxID=5580 RepID=A0ABR0TM16_AURPU
MPCRLQPYIWISDDALATAYRRFANTCLVNHSHTNTRRHGSNVPGPLEARRRLARRRMAGLSIAGSSPGIMPDFGALLGSGGLDMTSLWAPPTTTQSRAPNWPDYAAATPPMSRTIPTYQEHCASRAVSIPPNPSQHDSKRSLQEYTNLLAPCRTFDSLARAHTSLHPDSDVSENFSRAALHSLLNQSTPDQILAFLQSDLDHESASNCHAYLTHLFVTNGDPEDVLECVRLVCDKIVLSTMPMKELSDILDMLEAAAGVDDQLLLKANTMLHQSLVDAFAPNAPPESLNTRLFKNALSLRPSSDVSKLIAAAFPLSGRSKVMGRHLQKAIMARTKRPGPSDALMPILGSIPSEKLDRVIYLATQKLIKVLSDHTVTRRECIKRLVCWLEDLHVFRPSIFQPHSSCGLLLYPFLASRFTIAELGPHIMSLHPADAAIIVLHNWIKPTILEVPDPDLLESELYDFASNQPPATVRDMPLQPSQATSRYIALQPLQTTSRYIPLQSPPTTHSRHDCMNPFRTYGLRYTMSRSPDQSSTHQADLPTRQAIFNTIASSLEECCKPDRDGVLQSPGAAWVHLFMLLGENKIDYAGWLSDFFQVLKYHKSSMWTYYLFAELIDNDVKIPYPVAVDVMRHFLDIKKTQWALDVFNRSESNQWLSNIPELLFSLIENRAIGPDLVFDLLNRPDYANSLPTNLRSVAKNPLSQERVQLVHHVAYAMAKSPLLTSRMAFRRVCDCLNYLQDRGATVSSLMSRALVYAGVTRPLREGLWLSTEKFQWILQYVRRLEGDEVADSLDEAAFTARSENLDTYRANRRRLDDMDREADEIDWEYRKQFGHASHRWKRKTAPHKPGPTYQTRRAQARRVFRNTINSRQ